MGLLLIFFVLPATIYLSLCLLPRGRPAALGIGVAGAVAVAVWFAGDPADEADMSRVLAGIAGVAIALAALAQGARALLGPGRPGWVYPVLVALVLAGAQLAFLNLLGA